MLKLCVLMLVARRHLSWVVCFWLASQIAGVAAAPLAFCCARVVTADDEEKCCPGLLPGQVCPMHHKREGVRTCKMRDACGRADAALVALAGGVGVLPPATDVVTSPSSTFGQVTAVGDPRSVQIGLRVRF